MKQQAFTYVQNDAGLWRVLHYEKPIGLGLTVADEFQAAHIAQHLNRAVEQAHGQGYDAGHNSAESARWRS